MLILTREIDEVVTIGDLIRVQVIAIRRDGKVRLGIEAPNEIPVHRLEVYEAIQRAKGQDREDAA